MTPENLLLLKDGLNQLDLALSDSQLDRLVGYHDYLHQCNQSLNLTGLRDEQESVVKNLLNSLAPWKQIDPNVTTADVGTGGGLPGIPLGIALGMSKLTLIESKAKKCRFLEQACQQFLPDAKVLEADVNTVKQPTVQIISTALGTLEKLIRITTQMQVKGTRLVFWKGRREKINEEIQACPKNRQQWKVVPFKVPHLPDTERHLCTMTL